MNKENEEKKNTIALKSVLHFTIKEIMQMPIEFQKIITVKLEIPVRQKTNGVFEARFRSFGFNICVSSSDFDKLKPKFLAKLANYTLTRTEPQAVESPQQLKKPLFTETAARWLELRRPTIKARTYEDYLGIFGANIFPAFNSCKLDELKQSDCQRLINLYLDQGKNRTATKIYQTLKAVFDFAVGEELVEKSPMRLIKPPRYEKQNGVALTLEEEREFLKLLDESKCVPEIRNALIFLLYTGIRRSELASVRLEPDFVSVVSSKVRKGYNEKQRLIPITPMLARWLPCLDFDELRNVRPDALTQAVKRLMPAHHLHELRHTFITRCQECGVSRELVSVWAGHAPDNTQTSKVYTHFSREYMQREAQKVIYNL